MGFFSDAIDNMERRKQTREYIQTAKRLIKEGDELYERAYEKVLTYANKTESLLREHMYFKEKIANEMGKELLPLIKNFEIPDIHISKMPYLEGKKSGINEFSNVFVSSIVRNPIPLPSIFDIFVSEEDYYEARNQKDEAKMYKQQMKYEREKLYEYRDRMSILRDSISLERRELDELMGKLRHMTKEVESVKGKKQFSNDEKIYFRGIKSISEAIIQLLSEDFLNDDMEVKESYKNILKGIENINTSLPMIPSIQDTESVHVLDALTNK